MKTIPKQNTLNKTGYIANLSTLLVSILVLNFLFVGCSDEETDLMEETSNLSDLEVVTPVAAQGSLIQIKGDVGTDKNSLHVRQNGEEAGIVAFNANSSVTVRLSEDAISGPLTVKIDGHELFLGGLDVFENLVLPVFWIEADANGFSIFKGVRSLSGNTSRTPIINSTGFIPALAASPLTGELYYVVQDVDPETSEPVSRIVKVNAENGSNAQIILQTNETINALAVSALIDKVFYAESNSSDFSIAIKKTGMNGGTVDILREGILNDVSEMDYNLLTHSLYFVEARNKVNKISLSDNSLSTVYDSENFRIIGGMAIDMLGKDIYVADLGEPGDDSDVILKGSTDGTDPLSTMVNTNVSATLSMDFDNLFRKLYWLNSSFTGEPVGSIYRTGLGTVSPELIFDEIGLSLGMDVSGRTGDSQEEKKKHTTDISL
ncbi:hypothetical protein [Sinomicrobium sp. M5D2P9]